MRQSWILSLFPSVNLDHARFEPFRPGIERAILYSDPDSSAMTAYLRYAPGAEVPEHEHDGYEHILVLEGEQSDDDGSYPAGTLIIHTPGSRHRVRSETGCLVLAIWERPVRFVTS